MPSSLSRISELPSQRTGEWRRLDRSRTPQLQRHLFYDLSTTSLDRHSSTLALIVCPKLVLEDGPRIYHAQVCNIAKRLLAEPEKLDVTQSWLKKDLTVMLNQDKKKGGGTKATEDFCKEFAKNPKFDARITRVDLVARDLRLSLFGIFLPWGIDVSTRGRPSQRGMPPTNERGRPYRRGENRRPNGAGTAVATGRPPCQRGGPRFQRGSLLCQRGGQPFHWGGPPSQRRGTAVPTEGWDCCPNGRGAAVPTGGVAISTESIGSWLF